MKPKISAKALKFQRTISPVREIMSYADPAFARSIGLDPSEIISFAGGWVDHEAPPLLREAYQEIISAPETFHASGGYTPTRGSTAGKQAVVSFEQHLFGMPDLDPTQVVIGANSTQMLSALVTTLLDPDDLMVMLDPTYCNYVVQSLTAVDVKIESFPVLDQESWTYNADQKIDEFTRFIAERRPKMVLLVAPDNPTSQVLSDAFVKATLEAVTEVGGFLLIDFAYKTLLLDETWPDYFSWAPGDNYLSVHSNSKWSKNLGRRMGWIEAPPYVADAMESILSSTILCPDTLHQMAFARYVERAIEKDALRPYVEETREKYRAAASATVAAIREHLGFPCLEPQGGLYTCMPVGRDGAAFVEEVLRETGVLFVPGWGFGRSMRKAVRVSFGPAVNRPSMITEGFARVGRYLKK